MEVLKGESISKLDSGEYELHNCVIGMLVGNVRARLVSCNVENIDEEAIVILEGCSIESIGGNVKVTSATKCNIDKIKGNVDISLLHECTIGTIQECAKIDTINACRSIMRIEDRCTVACIKSSKIASIGDNTSIEVIQDSEIGTLRGNTIIRVICDVRIQDIKEYAFVTSARRSSIGAISGDASIYKLDNTIVTSIKDNTTILDMSNSICDTIEDSVKVKWRHNCTVDDKHANEYTLTQDTTPTLWKRADNKKRQVTIYLRDYYSNSHRDAIKQLVSILPGITVVSNDNDRYLLHVNDNIFNILQDMTLCDYIEMLVDDTIVV